MPAGAKRRKRARKVGASARPQRILAIDIGGTKIKFLLKGEHEPRKVTSGRRFTAVDLVEAVSEAASDWDFDAVSIGYPGLVGDQGPVSEPGNLGPGWLGFDFAGAFGVPVKIMNDAAMQALGSYEGGRMLFLSLGTGLGSTLIADNVIVPLELGQLPYADGRRLGVLVGRRGLKTLGKAKWRDIVVEMIGSLQGAFNANYTVLGGGNAKLIKELPPGARCGNNLAAFRGGFRMWNLDDVETLAAVDEHGAAEPKRTAQEWRVI
jgi:polyphosphate glucokinase